MPPLPSTNNVYGTMICGVSLANVERCLRERVGLPESSLRLHVSQFDGAQTLAIATELVEMEMRPGHSPDTWFFNGAVAGEPHEIREHLDAICQPLAFAGFPTKFEIYDEAFSMIGLAEFTNTTPVD
jgi:hypothetical protein